MLHRPHGVRFAYTGNVHDSDGSSTYCPGCGMAVVERDWYRLGAYRLTGDGHCGECGTRLAGVFDGPPGGWGHGECRSASPGVGREDDEGPYARGAGSFYPADPAVLRSTVEDALAAASGRVPGGRVPKAVIVPHIGYMYSASIAASASRRARWGACQPGRAARPRPSGGGERHRRAEHGRLLHALGLVPVDVAGREALVGAGLVVVRDDVHAAEHSLEVQLPCLQARWARCRSFPSPWATPTRPWWPRYWMQSGAATETLVVVSSDLSHYLDRASATEVDQRTAAAIVAREPHRLGPYDACGVRPVQGLLTAALRHGLHVDLLDLRRSADTAGDHERVVGYGAFALA